MQEISTVCICNTADYALGDEATSTSSQCIKVTFTRPARDQAGYPLRQRTAPTRWKAALQDPNWKSRMSRRATSRLWDSDQCTNKHLKRAQSSCTHFWNIPPSYLDTNRLAGCILSRRQTLRSSLSLLDLAFLLAILTDFQAREAPLGPITAAISSQVCSKGSAIHNTVAPEERVPTLTAVSKAEASETGEF